MKLIPWVVVLRDLGLMNTIAGLILIHTVQRSEFHDLCFCRKLLRWHSRRSTGRRRELTAPASFGFSGRIILPLVAADPDRERDLPVHRDLETNSCSA